MKRFRSWSIALAVMLLLAPPAFAAGLAGWTEAGGEVREAGTEAPVLGAGSAAIKAHLEPALKLDAVGDTLTLSGRVTFDFGDAGKGRDGGFRWGLFGSQGAEGDDGWSGYLVMNKRSGTVPLYRKRGGRGWNSVAVDGYQAVTGDIDGGLAIRDLISGTYAFELTLSRKEEGLLVEWSLANTANGYNLAGSWLDRQPVSPAFDRVILQATSGLGQVSLSLADLDLTGTGGAAADFRVVPGQRVAGSSRERVQRRLDKMPDFPKPQPAQAFAELKLFDAEGRFWRVPAEDWTLARERASQPPWKNWLVGQRVALDAWMRQCRDHADWRAGWGHQFISPKDGSYLTFTPEEPGEFLHSPTDSRVAVTPAIRAAWVNKFRVRHIEMVLEAARFYRLTGERKYLDWAVSQLDFYARHYREIEPHDSGVLKGKLFGNLLNDATTLVLLAQAARLIWDDVPADQRVSWGENLFYPQVRLLEHGYPCPINIACWQRSAQGLVALLYNDEALWRQVIDGPEGLRRQLGRGVTSDYIWFEQSIGYNYYVVAALVPLLEEAARQGRLEDIRDEAAMVENLILAPLVLAFPNGYLPNPADVTGRLTNGKVKRKLGEAAHLFPTPLGVQDAAAVPSWSTLTAAPLDAGGAPAAYPTVTSRALESTRFAVLKGGPWQVFIHFGQVDLNHAQKEALSFETCYGTHPISVDVGSVAYASPLYRGYYKAGLADNVPLVGGSPQDDWARGELVAFDPDANRAVVAQRPFVPGWNAEREFRIDGSRLIDTLTLSAAEPNLPATSLGFLLHLESDVRMDEASLARFEPAPDFARGRLEGFAHWTQVRQARATDEARFNLTVGGKPFELIIHTTGPFDVFVGRSPGRPSQTRTSLLVETTGRETTFETVLAPVGEAATAQTP